MSDAEDLFQELQNELQNTGQTLGDLLQKAIEDPTSAPDVATELLEEAADTGQSVGDLLENTIEDSDNIVGRVTEGDLFIDLGDEDFLLDFDDDILFVDPTSDQFEDVLSQLDIFGVGEELGFISSPETDEE